jgi:hypothetical protein
VKQEPTSSTLPFQSWTIQHGIPTVPPSPSFELFVPLKNCDNEILENQASIRDVINNRDSKKMNADYGSQSLDQWPIEPFLYFARFLDATDLLSLRLVSQLSRR